MPWPRITGRGRALGLVALVLLIASGCAVRLAYENTDRLARWVVGDFVTMNDAQRARFDAGVREVWDWHRRTQLPRYADFFDAMQIVLADGTTADEIQAIVNTVIEWALEIEQQALPVAVDLLTSLSDAQVGALARRLSEDNARMAKSQREQTLAQSQREWVEETAGRFSRFSGRLSRDQRAYLVRQSVRYLPESELWAAYRARWQANLLQLLDIRDDRARFAAGFANLAASRENYYGEELTHVFANNRALAGEATAWLVNSMSSRQQDRFLARLDTLAADFRSLTSESVDESTLQTFCDLIEC